MSASLDRVTVFDPVDNTRRVAEVKRRIQQQDNFNSIRKLIVSRNFEFRTVDFHINEQFEGNTVVLVSLINNIGVGNLIFNRSNGIIFYDELTYTLQIEYINTAEPGSTKTEGETKVALLSLLDPEIIEKGTNIFALINSKGDVIERVPSSPLNPSYRKSVVVIRDTYNHAYVHNSAQEGLTLVNLAEPEAFLLQKRVIFKSDGSLPDPSITRPKSSGDLLERERKTGSFKSTYFSDSGRGQPLKTQYNAITGEITYGDLVVLMIGGENPNITQNITITGRLKFY